MSSDSEQASTELKIQETSALLQRIADAIEHKGHKRWVEITSAVLLSLAAVASAWCAYEASRWGDVQTFRLAAANKADRAAMEYQLTVFQFRSFDASMLITYLQVRRAGNLEWASFLHQHFRPEMKRAVDAWLKMDPFNNPAAPPAPFHMAEYVLLQEQDAATQSKVAEKQHAAAHQANRTSDTYVLLTILFAIVLFFGGISGTLRSPRLQQATTALALLLFLTMVSFLAVMPICRE